ncbi:85/88 kDa calcium-independent phospholipase A2-like [Xenia sp. Carnegie-2017]|uniref:85/88 kDa calcium-independent phospholipase A2-like n=1 Tax=Xenia sp. Carnegie-2017 TaxID=2897299 RepID=UPI001F04FFCC|nr:85/88 kDa calcium-independent phospholipase A2-like [Xenia sp. Carnegie-2017]
MFGKLCEKLTPFYQSSSKCYDTQTLQSLLNCLEENPGMNLSVVARKTGLTECLKHEKIRASMEIVDATDSGDNGDKTLLQWAKFGFKGQIDNVVEGVGVSSLTQEDDKGNTVMHYAVSQPELLDKLLLRATELVAQVVNSVNSSEETPLHFACVINNGKGLQLLLEHGADLKVKSKHMFPIHAAVKFNSDECIKAILKFHKDCTTFKDSKYGGTPLHWVKTRKIAELLIMSEDIEAENNEGETPLHIMVKRKRQSSVVCLLSHGADVNALGMSNETPLHIAVKVGDVHIVKTLIVFGADINAVNSKGETPLHIATASKSLFRNAIIHSLCLVGAAPCDAPFIPSKYPVGKKPGNELSQARDDTPIILDDIAKIMASGAQANVKYKRSGSGKNENDGESMMKKKRKGDSALCLDGGGIRGLILIQVLLNLERVAMQPIVKLFDWIAGTSTGGILALGLLNGSSMAYLQQLYFRFKDEVFVGSRPYPSEPLEKFLRQEFGVDTKMTSVNYPRVLATAAVSDRIPPALHLFRNFSIPEDDEEEQKPNSPFPPVSKPADQLMWRAARGTGAAPTYFRAMGRMLDGGLIANNPTLDLISFLHSFYKRAEPQKPDHETCHKIGLVFSVGTGKPPDVPVKNIDVLRPTSMSDLAKVAFGAQALAEILVEQATSCVGAVVDRAAAWCEMINVFYHRLNPRIFSDVPLDTKDDQLLVNMLWECQVYIFEHRHIIKELADHLT